MKNMITIGLIASLSALALAGCGGDDRTAPTPGTGGDTEAVRFALDWTPNTNHTGIYVAQEKGWYAEEGINLELLPYSDANTPDTLVGTGQADFGVSFAEAVVTDRATGLPVKSVAAVLQTNTSAIVTLKSSGLDSPAKLEGKRYAGFGSPYEEPVMGSVIRKAGGPAGDYRNITTSVYGYQALVSGNTDFMWIFDGWEGVQARLEGVELNTFFIKEYGIPDYYTPVIIANETFLAEKSDVARRFLAATARGYEYGASEPEAAGELLYNSVPAGTFTDATLPRESQKYLAKHFIGDQAKWGVQTLEMWTDYPRFMAETGLLKDAQGNVVGPDDLDYASFFTNDYLPTP